MKHEAALGKSVPAGSCGSPELGALSFPCECKEASVAGAGLLGAAQVTWRAFLQLMVRTWGSSEKSSLGGVRLEECPE